jgi:hypothetical protein
MEMELENLLKASLQLEKRIATDETLRQYFSSVWAKAEPKPRKTLQPPGPTSFEFTFPPEMCELLGIAMKVRGKSAQEVMQESFAKYYLEVIEPAVKAKAKNKAGVEVHRSTGKKGQIDRGGDIN